MIDEKILGDVLAGFLPRQRWFAGDGSTTTAAAVQRTRVLRDEWPALLALVVEAAGSLWQVPVGLRDAGSLPGFLEGKADAVLGVVETERGPAIAYDATVDAELALCLLEQAMPGAGVERARPLGADQSNTSIVFDERVLMKLYRRLAVGPNPDVEVTRGLAEAGFAHTTPPLGLWRADGIDLAVVTEYLLGAVDGFQLALTSLRDLYDARVRPDEAGGDFGFEARRLGGITAELHLAMAAAFGTSSADTEGWAADMELHLTRVRVEGLDAAAIGEIYRRLRGATPGPAIRVHGDYHLGQVVRTDVGWYALDFEGEPDRPLHERSRPSSALRDVAGMLRSFHYAAEVALHDNHLDDDEARELAVEWERRNVFAFLRGYNETEGIQALLPPTESDHVAVLTAFLLDKAVYEVGYEASHRPDWVGIPLSAVRRILEEAPL